VSHKFYAALGKSKVLKGAERVLVAYSGTQSSATLLHLVRDGLGDHRKKKLVSDVIVTFIDGKTKSNIKSVNNHSDPLLVHTFVDFFSLKE
jgi:PP-loop superfamily ATP-utilizing enzyme